MPQPCFLETPKAFSFSPSGVTASPQAPVAQTHGKQCPLCDLAGHKWWSWVFIPVFQSRVCVAHVPVVGHVLRMHRAQVLPQSWECSDPGPLTPMPEAIQALLPEWMLGHQQFKCPFTSWPPCTIKSLLSGFNVLGVAPGLAMTILGNTWGRDLYEILNRPECCFVFLSFGAWGWNPEPCAS